MSLGPTSEARLSIERVPACLARVTAVHIRSHQGLAVSLTRSGNIIKTVI
jgi:hypothetical protein